MMAKPTPLAVVLLLTTALTGLAEEQTYRLQYKFQANQFVHYDVLHNMSITTRYGTTSETAVNESFARKHYRVVSVDPKGEAILELVLDHVKMKAQFGEHDPTTYDSTSTDPPPKQFKDVHERIGKAQVRTRFTASGELLEITAVDEKSPLSENERKDLVGQNFLLQFPDQPLKIGETWKDAHNVDIFVTQQLKQPVRLQRVYTLDAVEGNIARISMKTQILTPIREPAHQAQLIQRTPSGTIEFDMVRGLLISRELTIDDSVVGPFGPQSAMMAKSTRSEKLLTPEQVSSRPKPLSQQSSSN